ncbi:unnamed protein product, partial [Amoebophrya sp. A120]
DLVLEEFEGQNSKTRQQRLEQEAEVVERIRSLFGLPEDQESMQLHQAEMNGFGIRVMKQKVQLDQDSLKNPDRKANGADEQQRRDHLHVDKKSDSEGVDEDDEEKNFLTLPDDLEESRNYGKLFQQKMNRNRNWLIICGDTGTGKTRLAFCIAHLLKLHVFQFGSSDITRPALGDTESELRKVLRTAKRAGRSIVIWKNADVKYARMLLEREKREKEEEQEQQVMGSGGGATTTYYPSSATTGKKVFSTTSTSTTSHGPPGSAHAQHRGQQEVPPSSFQTESRLGVMIQQELLDCSHNHNVLLLLLVATPADQEEKRSRKIAELIQQQLGENANVETLAIDHSSYGTFINSSSPPAHQQEEGLSTRGGGHGVSLGGEVVPECGEAFQQEQPVSRTTSSASSASAGPRPGASAATLPSAAKKKRKKNKKKEVDESGEHQRALGANLQ